MLRKAAALAAPLALVVCASLPAPALADWPANGIEIVNAEPVLGSYPFGVLYYESAGGPLIDTPEGDFVLAHSPSSQTYLYWTLQRFHRDGTPRPGWLPTGLQSRNCYRSRDDRWMDFVTTEDGATWHVFADAANKLYAWRADSNGVVTSPPGAWGWQLGTSLSAVGAAPAPGNGLYVASNAVVRRITRTGGTAPGWPAGGRLALSAGSWLQSPYTKAFADGEGGVYVYDIAHWEEYTTPQGYLANCKTAQLNRIDSTGVRHPGWPANGLALDTLTAFVATDPLRTQLVRSGANSVLAAWPVQFGTAGENGLRLQKVNGNGTIAAGWPTNGRLVAHGASADDFTLLPDGAGGVYVLWFQYTTVDGVPFVTHVDSDGQFVGPVGATGTNPLSPGAQFVAPSSGGNRFGQHYADVAPDGGLFYAWGDLRQAPCTTFRLRRMNADLTPHSAEPDTGRVCVSHCSAFSVANRLRALRSDGAGGVYIGWDDGGIRMYHVVPLAAVGVASSQTASLLLRSPAPNPARQAITLRFTLPDARPATLTLFDVAGRAVRTSQATGAGEHVVRFDDSSLPAGLYLAQLRQGAEQRTVRVVLAR